MTIPEMFDLIDAHLAAWHADEIVAVHEGDQERARDIRLRIVTIEQLAIDLHDKAAA